MADTINDLKSLIKSGRAQEAKALFQDLPPDTDPAPIIEALALGPDETALDLIEFLMTDAARGQDMQDRLFQLTTDRAHLNYAFTRLLLAHGTPEQIRKITPLLKHILTNAAKGELLNLVLRTAGKHKLDALTTDVAEFIFFDDPDLKRESVKALERMGSAEALGYLEQIAATDKCDMDILDAIDVLREKLDVPQPKTAPAREPSVPASSAEPPEKKAPPEAKGSPGAGQDDLASRLTLLASNQLDQRLAAYGYFTDNPHLVAEALHRSLKTDNHDLLINLLRLITRTIPQKSEGDLLTLAAQKALKSSLKFALFTALAAYPELESAAAALEASGDASIIVRLPAVKVLDRHCSDYIAAEVKSRIETGTKKGEALAVTILDAGATNLIDALVSTDTFSYVASNYLERSAPVQAIDAFIQVLEKRNRISTLKKYSQLRIKRAEKKRPFFVVIHSTPAYLDIYTKLIHSAGFDVRCFSAPQEAFESIVFEKPAGIICDLFIRQITALELAGEVRELYPENEVPLIVSTLQEDLAPDLVEKAFKAAGITALCGFPVTASQIKSWGTGR